MLTRLRRFLARPRFTDQEKGRPVATLGSRAGFRQGNYGSRENEPTSRESELESPNNSLERRLDLLQAATELASQVGPLSTGDEIASRAVALAQELLGVEWAGLFLGERADEDVRAAERHEIALVAAQGEADLPLESPEGGLSPDVRALLARCIDSGEPQVAEESGQEWRLGAVDAVRCASSGIHPRSILLIPLYVREEAIGVLALGPGRAALSGTGFIDAARYAAGQVALALYRAEMYARLQARADESKRLVQRYVEESWDRLVTAQPRLAGYRYTPHRSQADEHAWLPPMTRAIEEGMPVVEEAAGEALLAVPLVQSGIIIGAIGLRRSDGQPWSEDEQLLVRAASEQVTQALESRRLFELAHDRAQRERLLRRVTERIRSQADLDGSLRVASEQLQRITGATHVAIRLSRRDRDA